LPHGIVSYLNLPHTLAAVISDRMATLHELDTVYGVEDLWLMLEVRSVDNHNRALMNKAE
jgi:hypothetical protein